VTGGKAGLIAALSLLAMTCACAPPSDTAERRETRTVATVASAENSLPPAENESEAPAAPAAPATPTRVATARVLPPLPGAKAAEPLDLPPSNASTDPTPFPTEVTRFMVDRDGCDHFRGEEPYDAERRAYLEKSIRDLCTGTDSKLADLRKRYAGNHDVTAALSGYEDRIEAAPTQ
jgi:hypothetical protein